MQSRYKKINFPYHQDLLDYLAANGQTKTLKNITDALFIKNNKQQRALLKCIKQMQHDGQIIADGDAYRLAEKNELYRGTVIGHPDGYGFVTIENNADDLYLSPQQMRSLLHGDHITVRPTDIDKRGRRAAIVVEILQRANQSLVGRYFKEHGVAVVVPCNKRIHQDILIADSKKSHAQTGQYVLVDITRQPDEHTQPVGRIVEILGQNNKINIAAEIAIKSHALPHDWPADVLLEADQFTDHINTDDIAGREDLRDLALITIDGENARDFDDAVYCEPQGTGWRLLVAIADVSHYVRTGTAIDDEALGRGNSVYFPHLVIPMLPEILSNDICSLNPRSDRLCMVCELHINRLGVVKHYRFFEGVMNSAARVTYNEFIAVINRENSQLLSKYAELRSQFESLYQLFLLLHDHRKKSGLLDFRSTEPIFTLDSDDRVLAINTLPRNDGHRLIEEFMLRANAAAANFILQNKIPGIYRVHDKPEHDSLDNLHSFLAEMKLTLSGGAAPTAKDYAALLDRGQQRKDAHIIEMLLLRSMQLAIYSEKNSGHFGLAFPEYTHFTSPIRRYSDLIIHRCIRHLIHHQPLTEFAYSTADMAEFAKQCSMTDRRAEEACRDVIQWYKCQFMESQIGNIYYGTISGVVPFGLFVELDDIYVDGLIHIKTLPRDYYHFDAVSHCLIGNRRKTSFRLGDRTKVRVAAVNIDDGKIDFELAG